MNINCIRFSFVLLLFLCVDLSLYLCHNFSERQEDDVPIIDATCDPPIVNNTSRQKPDQFECNAEVWNHANLPEFVLKFILNALDTRLSYSDETCTFAGSKTDLAHFQSLSVRPGGGNEQSSSC